MGKLYDAITPELADWIRAQPLFFVATAPLAASGHVNCSPKGLDTLRIVGERSVAYLDLTGSGAETIAHLRENARIVFMFCAFAGPPKIVRLHGKGRVVTPAAAEWASLRTLFPGLPGARGIVVAEIERIADSCGYAVPRLDHVADRDALPRWTAARGPGELPLYRRQNNLRSIDGLPSLNADET